MLIEFMRQKYLYRTYKNNDNEAVHDISALKSISTILLFFIVVLLA